MDVTDAIEQRRALRAFSGEDFDDKTASEIVHALTQATLLSPSALNRQPWQLVFVTERGLIERLASDALLDFNTWAAKASMIVAVCGADDDDVVDADFVRKHVQHPTDFDPAKPDSARTLHLLLIDLGIAAAFMMLRATELGYVAHPIAGYVEDEVQAILEIPEALTVALLLVVGRHDPDAVASLPASFRHDEQHRPPRHSAASVASRNRYRGS
jgi:nitroreductase